MLGAESNTGGAGMPRTNAYINAHEPVNADAYNMAVLTLLLSEFI